MPDTDAGNFMEWLFRDGGLEPPRRDYDSTEDRLTLLLDIIVNAALDALAAKVEGLEVADWLVPADDVVFRAAVLALIAEARR